MQVRTHAQVYGACTYIRIMMGHESSEGREMLGRQADEEGRQGGVMGNLISKRAGMLWLLPRRTTYTVKDEVRTGELACMRIKVACSLGGQDWSMVR